MFFHPEVLTKISKGSKLQIKHFGFILYERLNPPKDLILKHKVCEL